jgi:hypothetical protein
MLTLTGSESLSTLLILRHFERGEHDPEYLADSAVLDFLR